MRHTIAAENSRTRRLAQGLALLGIGAAWLLASHGRIPPLSAWLILPLLLGGSALIHLAGARTLRQALRSALHLACAAWLAAGLIPASGVILAETWPAALLIFLGASSLIRSLPRQTRS